MVKKIENQSRVRLIKVCLLTYIWRGYEVTKRHLFGPQWPMARFVCITLHLTWLLTDTNLLRDPSCKTPHYGLQRVSYLFLIYLSAVSRGFRVLNGRSNYALVRTCVSVGIELVTFRVSRRRREMWSRASVCLSVCPRPHAYTIARTRV